MRGLTIRSIATVFGSVFCTSLWADLVVPTERVITNVSIREEQSSESTVLSILRPGESFEWIRNVGRWREVRISPSETGFVSRSFTRRIADDPNPPDDPLPNRAENEQRIHFLPVGAGSCTVVECPGQDAPPMIFDCGSLGAGSRGPGDMDEPAAATEVKAILAGKPDPNVVISHADKDHIDYMDSILDTVQATHIWTGGADADYPPAFNTLHKHADR